METNKIYQGSALEVLKTFPSESIDMVMTSPPYWALRDYGVEGQLGLEPTFDEYIKKLCDIFDIVNERLKKTGACWVNLGDSYSTLSGGMAQGKWGTLGVKAMDGQKIKQPKTKLPDKCLCMIPERFAIEMINRGWILRNQIIWHKPNSMPSSVQDRFTGNFEKLFFFVKNQKYWFDKQFEPHESKIITEFKPRKEEDKSRSATIHPRSNSAFANPYNPLGRNKRCVWTINTKPYSEAHFAVYPEELCQIPIKSCCPEGGVVLDPFFGAGTTGLAAVKLDRKFVGIELNQEYIKIAEKRLKPHLEQTKLNIP